MDGAKSILEFCLCAGSLGLCIILVVGAILRWLAPSDSRAGRLNKLAAIAAVILCLVCLFSTRGIIASKYESVNSGTGATMETSIEVVQMFIKLLLLGVGVASILMLFATVVLFLAHGLKALFDAGTQETNSLEKRLNNITKRFKLVMKTPAVTAIITWGLLALFFFLPILAGNTETGSLIETWKSGVIKIAELGAKNSNSGKFGEVLGQYISLAVILVGLTFAIFKFLFLLLSQEFADARKNDILDEHSKAIGVLSVGVIGLWTLQTKESLDFKDGKVIYELTKAFCSVMLIMALIVLTLEVIRLLLDMKQRLIRREANYLFISLIGQSALLLFSALHAIYNAASSAIGVSDNDALRSVEEKIRRKMTEAMVEQLSGDKRQEAPFRDFEETVTKEDEEEEI